VTQLPEHVLTLAKDRFPGYSGGNFEVVPIEKGGSDRVFYRLRTSAETSMIIVRYSGHKEENRHYVEIGQFLSGSGVNVPRVYLHDPAQGLIFMEDLGEADLWSWRNHPWEVRRLLYQAALDQALLLHSRATARFSGSGLRLENEFSGQLYLWEQNYFFDHCLGSFFGLPSEQIQELKALPKLASTADQLASLPRTLVHRDFQSQNVLTVQGRAWLIDFQGMRLGLPHYDVASLIYDPYVSLSLSEREELIEYYQASAHQEGLELSGNFEEILNLCAMQRLMQALGAYGFLGIQKQRRHFLDHIPVAGQSLTQVLSRMDGMDALSARLDSALQHLPAR
jgi:aminoglycoside/choline kinase family phosphotransferase